MLTLVGIMNSSSYRDIAWKRVISVTQSNRIHDWNKQVKQSKHEQSCVFECNAISGGKLKSFRCCVDSLGLRCT